MIEHTCIQFFSKCFYSLVLRLLTVSSKYYYSDIFDHFPGLFPIAVNTYVVRKSILWDFLVWDLHSCSIFFYSEMSLILERVFVHFGEVKAHRLLVVSYFIIIFRVLFPDFLFHDWYRSLSVH